MRFASLLVASVVVLAQAPALAQPAAPVDDAARVAARKLGEEGLALYDKGDYVGALDKLDRAYAILPAPTLGLMSARALEKLGRWVEASERYLEVARAKVDKKALPAMKRAPGEAEHDRAALMPRIPTVEIALENAKPDEVTLTIDGKETKSAMVGVPLPVDPGEHVVRCTRGADVAEEHVKLSERDAKHLVLRLPLRAATAPSKVADAPAPHAPAPDADGAPASSMQRTIGWSAVALGGAGVVLGAVTGGLAVAKRSDLDAAGCKEGVCPPATSADVDAYGRLRTLSTIGFVAGGACAALGAVLVVTAPHHVEPAQQASIAPWIGVGSAGLSGRF